MKDTRSLSEVLNNYVPVKRGTEESKEALMKNIMPYDSDRARVSQVKSVISRNANKAMKDHFHLTAKNFLMIQQDLPEMQATDVIQMAMIDALGKGNYEDAARYAGMLCEFQKPKLARLESTNINVSGSMTDEELARIIAEEKL